MMLTKCYPSSVMLRGWNPVDELAGFRRLFDEPVAVFPQGCMDTAPAGTEWRPLVDVVETKEQTLLKVEIPGVKPEDFTISIEKDTLTVKGERRQEVEATGEAYTRMERAYGTFQRSMILPPTVDADNVKATYRNGVLEIQLPKKEEAKPKAIQVEVG
ncbi:MAG TPA: Hsp20/alpha crystallin family protein [Candidatus Methylomirabilis sp.]|nr:Hsp20/alpha crystallin family protein [Candidatus Methylomirabilis sp.]